MGGKDGRSRTWAITLYPDSVPEFWQQILIQLGVPVLVSPLHDQDVWLPEDTLDDATRVAGERKKAHWHVLIKFNSEKSFSQVCELLSDLNIGYCEKVSSYRQYARYLCHLDDPHKHQYSPQDVVCLNKAKYCTISADSLSTARLIECRPVFEFCRDNSIWDWQVLVDYCFESREDWLPIINHRRTDIVGYMRSLEHQALRNKHLS